MHASLWTIYHIAVPSTNIYRSYQHSRICLFILPVQHPPFTAFAFGFCLHDPQYYSLHFTQSSPPLPHFSPSVSIFILLSCHHHLCSSPHGFSFPLYSSSLCWCSFLVMSLSDVESCIMLGIDHKLELVVKTQHCPDSSGLFSSLSGSSERIKMPNRKQEMLSATPTAAFLCRLPFSLSLYLSIFISLCPLISSSLAGIVQLPEFLAWFVSGWERDSPR